MVRVYFWTRQDSRAWGTLKGKGRKKVNQGVQTSHAKSHYLYLGENSREKPFPLRWLDGGKMTQWRRTKPQSVQKVPACAPSSQVVRVWLSSTAQPWMYKHTGRANCRVTWLECKLLEGQFVRCLVPARPPRAQTASFWQPGNPFSPQVHHLGLRLNNHLWSTGQPSGFQECVIRYLRGKVYFKIQQIPVRALNVCCLLLFLPLPASSDTLMAIWVMNLFMSKFFFFLHM